MRPCWQTVALVAAASVPKLRGASVGPPASHNPLGSAHLHSFTLGGLSFTLQPNLRPLHLCERAKLQSPTNMAQEGVLLRGSAGPFQSWAQCSQSQNAAQRETLQL
ncbi:hypothetical protein AAFF_G00098750 [Aldrovandia affinis]|uniref:Uncharacterized protein n=1 Tax=Aldrovandia affinis TaxID=143900 RepID=A0AAD7RVC8_9TELE|nr:hypothetical protein AAFF_G00098750 [Aldrovandia affinis]